MPSQRERVDFLNCHAPPFCSPSRAFLLPGRYLMGAGIQNTIGGVSILHGRERTLADLLGAQGYRTAVFGNRHLGYSYPFGPRDRGFQETFVHGGGGIGQLEDYLGNNPLGATYLYNGVLEATEGFSSDVLSSEVMKFIEHEDDKPFFCFVSTSAKRPGPVVRSTSTFGARNEGFLGVDPGPALVGRVQSYLGSFNRLRTSSPRCFTGSEPWAITASW